MKCRFLNAYSGVVILFALLGATVAILIRSGARSPWRRRRVMFGPESVERSDNLFWRARLESWRSVGSLGSARSIGSNRVILFHWLDRQVPFVRLARSAVHFALESIGSFLSIASIASAASLGSFARVLAHVFRRAHSGARRAKFDGSQVIEVTHQVERSSTPV